MPPRKKASKPKIGRPPRTDDARRVAVYVPGELARWLRVHAAEYDTDMSVVVTGALESYRRAAGMLLKKVTSPQEQRAALEHSFWSRREK